MTVTITPPPLLTAPTDPAAEAERRALLASLADDDNGVSVRILLDLDDLLHGDPDALLDDISATITGSIVGLEGFTLTAVGAQDGKAVVQIDGTLGESLLDDLTEDQQATRADTCDAHSTGCGTVTGPRRGVWIESLHRAGDHGPFPDEVEASAHMDEVGLTDDAYKIVVY